MGRYGFEHGVIGSLMKGFVAALQEFKAFASIPTRLLDIVFELS
jgi:hypothetical protein